MSQARKDRRLLIKKISRRIKRLSTELDTWKKSLYRLIGNDLDETRTKIELMEKEIQEEKDLLAYVKTLKGNSAKNTKPVTIKEASQMNLFE